MHEDCGQGNAEYENRYEQISGLYLHWVWVAFGCGFLYIVRPRALESMTYGQGGSALIPFSPCRSGGTSAETNLVCLGRKGIELSIGSAVGLAENPETWIWLLVVING